MSGDGLAIPAAVADVTPAWLTRALANAVPGVDVDAIKVEPLHDGTAFTGRLHVTYRAGSAAGPKTLCLKAGLDAPHRDFALKAGLCTKEAMIYRDVLPKTSARVAACFASGYEIASGKAFILMEDLSAMGATFCGAEAPLTPEQAATGLGQLAELHAFLWNDSRLLEPRWRHRGRSLAEPDPMEKQLLDIYRQNLRAPHGGAVSHLFHRPEVMRSALARLRALDDASAISLIHGDAHIGNFFLNADQQACMTDFQCVQRGHYAHDLANFIGSSLDVDDRRRHEKELVQLYLRELQKRGITAPSFDEAWLGYRRHMVYALWAWLITSDAFQNNLRLVTCVFRFGLAALDLDSLEAIGH